MNEEKPEVVTRPVFEGRVVPAQTRASEAESMNKRMRFLRWRRRAAACRI